MEPIIPLIGEDNIIWGADYPHPDCLWPDSRSSSRRTAGCCRRACGARSRRRTWSSFTTSARRVDMSASAQGLRQVGYFDCPGGGQVVVDGRVAYIAHMKAPHGTSIVDVSDPKSPRQ